MNNFKKITALVVAVMMVMSLFTITAFADTTKTMTVGANKTAVGLGDTFQVTYTLSDDAIGDFKVSGLNFEVEFDPEKVSVTSDNSEATVTKNKVKFLHTKLTPVLDLKADAPLVTLTFTVLGGYTEGDAIKLAPEFVKYNAEDISDTNIYVIDNIVDDTAITVVDKYKIESVITREVTDIPLNTKAAETEGYLNENIKTGKIHWA